MLIAPSIVTTVRSINSDVRVIHVVVSRISLRAMDPTKVNLLGLKYGHRRGCDGIQISHGRNILRMIVVEIALPLRSCDTGLCERRFCAELQSELLSARVSDPLQTISWPLGDGGNQSTVLHVCCIGDCGSMM
jgi:hypothetical protein